MFPQLFGQTTAESISPPVELATERIGNESLYELCEGTDGSRLTNRYLTAGVVLTLSSSGENTPSSTTEVRGTIQYLEPAQRNGTPQTPDATHPLVDQVGSKPLTDDLVRPFTHAKSITTKDARAGRMTATLGSDVTGCALESLVDSLKRYNSFVIVQVRLVPLGDRFDSLITAEDEAEVSAKYRSKRVDTNNSNYFGVGVTIAGAPGHSPNTTPKKDVENAAKHFVPDHVKGSITAVSRDPTQARNELTSLNLRPEPSGLYALATYATRRLPPVKYLEAKSPVSLGTLPMIALEDDEMSWLLGDEHD